jgi:phosphonate dehydrogenase
MNDFSERPLVVITQRVHAEVLDLLGRCCRVWVNADLEPLSQDQLIRRAAEAQALLVFMPDRIDDNFLKHCPYLRVIGGALKGYDNFDVEACTRRGIWFTIVPDLLTESTADLVVGLMIALSRHILSGDRLIREGDFRGWRPQFYGTGLGGKQAGIIGLGALGQAVARRLAAFDMKIVYTDIRSIPEAALTGPSPAQVSLEELLRESDFVIPLVPLTSRTKYLLNADTLALMKPGSLLINAGRGSVVDESAVAEALEKGHLGGYAADVFEMEDWALPNRPDAVNPRLLARPDRTVFTPHLGSAVGTVRLQIEREAAVTILEALRGEIPRGAVNRPVKKTGI